MEELKHYREVVAAFLSYSKIKEKFINKINHDFSTLNDNDKKLLSYSIEERI